ncbi:MAG: glycosyltransferase family 9 protein [Bryobacterales bacterium]|nr:glycosyltransferase family 9 protein [Bryobacteraceae bacterium]MDW8129125.1 glycosyltransferase family 9 protein [Bryobacterales bacterium]
MEGWRGAAMSSLRILVVRLSSMGDVVHALPAAASLKHSHSGSELWWLVARPWAPLLEGNPFVDRLVCLRSRRLPDLLATIGELRGAKFGLAVDFQGLVQSALLAWLARPGQLYGFHRSAAREKAAAIFYSRKVRPRATHVVERNLELAAAAGAGNLLRTFWLPEGEPEGELPAGPFVLASPLAGWPHKQWPLEYYAVLDRLLRLRLGLPLVLCAPPTAGGLLAGLGQVRIALSGVRGLIYATRRATAVVGVDSGPLHLAAALGKIGVAIYGPTDPARNGPYGGGFTVLRRPEAVTNYKRRREISPWMRAVTPDEVLEALAERLARAGEAARAQP